MAPDSPPDGLALIPYVSDLSRAEADCFCPVFLLPFNSGLAEFAAAAAKKVKSFFPGTCASEKILLGLPVCERSECAQQAVTFSNESPTKWVSLEVF
jgi:hypothetical protein